MLLAIAVGAVVVTAMGIGTIVWRSSSRSSDAATISPLAVELGCASCHSVDGTRREGPTWQGLAAGKSFVLINDHDPKPLYYQFDAEHKGQFSWEYLESGPEVWRVRIGKTG